MAAHKGHAKVGGRVKGSPKFAAESEEIRAAVQTLVRKYMTGEGARSLAADMEVLRPAERAPLMERFLKYFMPTLGTLTSLPGEENTPMEIIVRHVKKDIAKDTDANDQDYSDPDYR